MSSLASCLFCKIVKGEIPCMKLLETDTVLAFMDIGPIAKGHCLVIPKYHAVKLTDLPDDQMADILPTCKKLAVATGAEDFNILQNNGRAAHQEVDHVHFHVIPKPDDKEGLGVGWPVQGLSKEAIATKFEEMKRKL
ncbi:hit protein 1 [Apiotrichum porosum]|uniref:Hit protein 1 n=1 Tax=Apiotrichum porosum TaxID=105984 RepID=A0A427Y0S7_9TREE|nr:hit protein 1 [Apiotrichum porosum]RSH84677.1 hit protein 1 [Apiotrichum porosum]